LFLGGGLLDFLLVSLGLSDHLSLNDLDFLSKESSNDSMEIKKENNQQEFLVFFYFFSIT